MTLKIKKIKTVLGSNVHPYELIFDPHVDEDHINILCYLKYVNLTFKKKENIKF